MKPLEILVAAASLVAATGCEYHGDPPPLALTEVEIIRMSKEGMPPDEIIDAIRRSRTIYILDAKDVVRLHEAGVDDKVVDYMLKTRLWDIENRSRLHHHHHHHYCDPYWCGHHHWHAGFGWYVW